jgi:hypothetical protein
MSTQEGLSIPKTLKHFKNLAKKYAREKGIIHMMGLNEYAKLCGFDNYSKVIHYYSERS